MVDRRLMLIPIFGIVKTIPYPDDTTGRLYSLPSRFRLFPETLFRVWSKNKKNYSVCQGEFQQFALVLVYRGKLIHADDSIKH